MYSTGKHYGLTINSLVDERRDPLAATHAAARYLVDLNSIYKDWTLALAAYNCGPGNVNKAIRRSGGKRDFWQIYYYLPRETRGYVPAFIAATYAMNYHGNHLITRSPVTLPLHTDTIRLTEQVHLKQIAEVLHLPVEELRDLNPQYRADVVPATKERPYAVKLPAEVITVFIDLQDSILNYRDSIYFNRESLVASPHRYTAVSVDLPAEKYDKLYYTVRSGDNVGYIADWYDVRASDLRYWNNISRNLIRAGQKLVIYEPKGKSARYQGINQMSFTEKQRFAGRETRTDTGSGTTQGSGTQGGSSTSYITYTVRPGDTLWEIARKYPGVDEDDIARLNGLTNASSIKPGQVIKIKPKG
jgi:membrane-bound lytic murein transglycosylase D